VGIPLELIKTHGTWASDAVFTYINPVHSAQSAIPVAMARAAKSRLVHN
jgi:hypothetical protein